MNEYGIIGYPLTHSFSPQYFANKFAQERIAGKYTPFPLKDISELPHMLQTNSDLRGFNVTIPYKTSIIPFLQRRDADVVAIGACNCVLVEEGKLVGYNTDWRAFMVTLQSQIKAHHTRALVLGNGGAAKAVVFAMKQLGISYDVASRYPGQGNIGYSGLTTEAIKQYPIIINTTPLGMHPDEGTAPDIPYEGLGGGHLLYDLIYNPAETKFLAKGKAAGAQIKNGQEMLELQAEYSWKIWQDVYPTV